MDTDKTKLNEFLTSGASFFNWNSGKNTPNILMQFSENIGILNKNLSEQIGKLDESLNRTSESSDRLAKSLNQITMAGTIIAVLGFILAIISFFSE